MLFYFITAETVSSSEPAVPTGDQGAAATTTDVPSTNVPSTHPHTAQPAATSSPTMSPVHGSPMHSPPHNPSSPVSPRASTVRQAGSNALTGVPLLLNPDLIHGTNIPILSPQVSD